MHHLMNRYLAIQFILVFMLLIHMVPVKALANSKTQELQRKIADIRLLKQQLADRRLQAETVLAALIGQQNELMAEIHLLQKSLGLKSHQQAQDNARVRYDIELLRTIMAFTNKFTEKIRLYQTGHDKLTYLNQLAQDDIKMIDTLHDLEIDALTTQISLVINKYLGEAHIIQIDPEKIEPTPPESIWLELAKSRN